MIEIEDTQDSDAPQGMDGQPPTVEKHGLDQENDSANATATTAGDVADVRATRASSAKGYPGDDRRDFVMPFERGALVAGKYQVDGLLGVGGVGYVLAAVHVALDEPVAIKVLYPAYTEDPSSVARFLVEAKAGFSLNSPHIVRVLDVDTLADGTPYMVMERLHGSDLRALLDEHSVLDVGQAVHYTLQACIALLTAHAAGVVHRDVKPENLFLTRVEDRDIIKVLDFGISRVVSIDPSWTALSCSLADDSGGTPAYMAPEQVQGPGLADARTDIWALGCVLYELLTGTVPFMRPTAGECCIAVLRDEPPAIQQYRRVPVGLEAVVLRCLVKHPVGRFQSVAELAAALAPFAQSQSQDYVQQFAGQDLMDAGPPNLEPDAPNAFHDETPTTVDRLPVAPAMFEDGGEITMIERADTIPGRRRHMALWLALLLMGPVLLIAAATHWSKGDAYGASAGRASSGASPVAVIRSPPTVGSGAEGSPVAESPFLQPGSGTVGSTVAESPFLPANASLSTDSAGPKVAAQQPSSVRTGTAPPVRRGGRAVARIRSPAKADAAEQEGVAPAVPRRPVVPRIASPDEINVGF